ncbi:MAG: DNA polymerase III subunit delta [Leadbetterella sp.]
MAKNINDLLGKISEKSLKPLYFLHGAEPYFIHAIADKIIDIAIPDHEKGFNEYILFGKDVSISDVLSFAMKYPMMAERQLVLVKEAQAISDITNKDSLDKLAKYFDNPLPSTILVLVFDGEMDTKKNLLKSAEKHGEVHYFKALYDSEIPEFIISKSHSLGFKISPKATQLLSDYIGNNLSAISNELSKIKLNLKDTEEIDANTIEKYVGVSKEYNIFEFQKALSQRNMMKSMQIVKYFADNEKDNPIVLNTSALYNYFSKVLQYHSYKKSNPSEIASALKVSPYFVKDYERAAGNFPVSKLMQIIHALNVLDQKSKGVNRGNTSTYDLYKDFVISALY